MAAEKTELREYRIEGLCDGHHLGLGYTPYSPEAGGRTLKYWHNRLELYKGRSLGLRWLSVKSSEKE
jgi:hypothetical protein